MKEKIKILGVLTLAGFSFFYTKEATNIIRNNDPIMTRINEVKDDYMVSKIDGILMNDEYITGINGCIVDEKDSYNNMKNVGSFKEELLVMKEDKIKTIKEYYIIGGNKEKRNISIILLDINDNVDKFLKENNIKINYFLDGKYIVNNIDKLIKIKKYSNIYNYGRNKEYLSKYIVYDNTVINTNFNNESVYCLFNEKNEKQLKLCNSYKMQGIKGDSIKDDLITYIKDNLSNGKIFILDTKNSSEIKMSINYILSKGYNIVSLDELLNEKNTCN